MKRALLFLLAACGSGSAHHSDAARDTPVDIIAVDRPIDAPVTPLDASGSNAGFTPPTAPLDAWTGSGGTYTQATLDLSCLGTARNDPPTSVQVTLTVHVRDFQSHNVVPSAQVAAYTSFGTPFATATSNSSGDATLTIPTGKTRIGFDLTESSSVETITPDQLLAAAIASQAITLDVMSSSTAATLPALVGLTRQPTTAIVVGTIHDCAGANIANAIATVSSTPATATELPGADTYYFSDAVDLPVHHNQQAATSKDGLFMVIGLPGTTLAYVQIWGYRTAGDLASHTLSLIAQLAVPLPASSAVLTAHDPRAT